jgi:hypothetical protein
VAHPTLATVPVQKRTFENHSIQLNSCRPRPHPVNMPWLIHFMHAGVGGTVIGIAKAAAVA